jgi:hypothetical protein
VARVATTPGLRPLGLGEILDVGIKLCARHWRTLALCVVWLIVPAQIVSVLILLAVAPEALDPTRDTSTLDGDEGRFLLAQGLAGLVQGVVYAIAVAACFRAIADAYLGAEPEPRRSLGFAKRRLPNLIALGATVLAAYAAVAGAIVLLAAVAPALAALLVLAGVAPFVWIVISWSLSTTVVLLEDAGPLVALQRSTVLVRGQWWKVLGTLLLTGLLVLLAAGVIQAVVILGPAEAANGDDGILAVANVIGGSIGAVLTTPFTAVVLTLLYFDARVRTDGFVLERLATELGEAPPEPPAWPGPEPAAQPGGWLPPRPPGPPT